jgi:AbrB family looped-hinge helix DNA binding protein
MEEKFELVKAFSSGKPDSILVVIPSRIRKKLGIARGEYMTVSVDGEGRIIYERFTSSQKS